jgi:glycerate kinase
MHILIAPNAFKNSLDTQAAAAAIAEGLLQSNLDCSCECFPIGDGGDGTGDLIINKLAGKIVYAEVTDPLGRKISAPFGLIEDGNTAVIEMAAASGIRLLRVEELDPLKATSTGTGEQIKKALDLGVKKIIIGMGGSATVDGGCGILQALGVRFLDSAGKALFDIPARLIELAAIDLSSVHQRIKEIEITVLCDVDNVLLGPQGSAAVFGPQKGAKRSDIERLNAGLARLSDVAFRQTGKEISAVKYGGTAGGAAAGLYAFFDANLVNGIDYFLTITDFNKALNKCDLVITGEGSIDEQTLQGKGPFGVAVRAKNKGVPVIGLAGRVPLERNEKLGDYFNALLSINHQPLDLPEALMNTKANLTRMAREFGNLLAIGQKLRV